MIKPRVYCAWSLHVDDFEVPVDIYCDGSFMYFDNTSDAIKILWINEPEEILSTPYQHARTNYSQYDFVLTWDQTLLDIIPNAVYFRNDMCWIPEYVPGKKIYGISTIVGFKNQTIGHKLRHHLWKRKNEISTPKYFYSSMNGGPKSNLILGDSKYPLFDYQFHIAIENVMSLNMITEKLTDCCRSKTIPIYWGCPNVKDTYDERGIIQCNNLDEIISACNEISPSLYNSMLPYIEENYKRSLELVPIDGKSKISETISMLIDKIKHGTNIFKN